MKAMTLGAIAAMAPKVMALGAIAAMLFTILYSRCFFLYYVYRILGVPKERKPCTALIWWH